VFLDLYLVRFFFNFFSVSPEWWTKLAYVTRQLSTAR